MATPNPSVSVNNAPVATSVATPVANPSPAATSVNNPIIDLSSPILSSSVPTFTTPTACILANNGVNKYYACSDGKNYDYKDNMNIMANSNSPDSKLTVVNGHTVSFTSLGDVALPVIGYNGKDNNHYCYNSSSKIIDNSNLIKLEPIVNGGYAQINNDLVSVCKPSVINGSMRECSTILKWGNKSINYCSY